MKKILIILLSLYSFLFSFTCSTTTLHNYSCYENNVSFCIHSDNLQYVGSGSINDHYVYFGGTGLNDFQTGVNVSGLKFGNPFYWVLSAHLINCDTGEAICPSGQVWDENLSSCVTPAPTCSDNVHLENNVCIADDGYHLDGNISKPDITCPPSMKYKYVKNSFYQFDTKTCVPDTNITQAQCLNIPGASWEEKSNYSIFTTGGGCFDKSYFLNNSIGVALGFNPFGSLSTQPDLIGSFIGKIYGYGKNKLFASGSKLWDSIKSSFSPSDSLSTTQPDIINMSIGSDGVTYQVSPTPKTPSPPSTGWKSVYDRFLDNGWTFPKTSDGYSDVPDLKINRPTFPTVSNPDSYYNGGDAISFKNNNILSSNLITDTVIPDLSSHLNDSPLNSFSVDISVKPDFLKQSSPVVFPTNFTKIKTLDMGGGVLQHTFKGKINLSDGSFTDYKIVKTVSSDGSSVNDVTVSYPVNTSTGQKIFSNNFVVNADSAGSVTSSFNNPSSISYVDNSGHVVTSNNADSSSAVDVGSGDAIDLTSVNSRLDSIEVAIKDLSDFKPIDSLSAENSLNDFKTASNIFDVNFHSYLDYLNNLKLNFTQITTQFNDAKAVLENKPVINQINGVCGFDVVLYNQPIHVDPCMFISPYRPLLSIFFTLYLSFLVLMFAVKYLIGGKN